MLVILRDATFLVTAHPDPDHPELCMVRARVRGDLERVWSQAKVRVKPNAEYPFEARMPRYVVDRELRQAVAAIDYPDFGLAFENSELLGATERLAMYDAAEDAWCDAANRINVAEEDAAAKRLLQQAREETAA